jgi:hypothetical protein
MYSFASSFFTSDQQCEELAVSWLKINSLESYEINWSSLVYPHIEVGRAVEVFEPKQNSDTPTKFLLDTVEIPLDLGTMSSTGKRVLATL